MADLNALTEQANALKAAGRLDEAIATFARAVAFAPSSGAAEHNLAAAQGDAGRFAEAEVGCRRALAKGLNVPETWLVLARALQGLSRLDEADAAYRQALARRPSMADAHRDLAQLIWMRTADRAAASAMLDRAIAAHPGDLALRLVRSKLCEYVEDFDAAYRELERALAIAVHPALDVEAANAALRLGRAGAALAHAERAAGMDRSNPNVLTVLAQVCLAAGQPERTCVLLGPQIAAAPDDQYLLALEATAWRLLGDARYGERMDYPALVAVRSIDAPAGWPSLDAYLAELAAALRAEHRFEAHPFTQSLRQGSQAPDILAAAHPAIQAFPQAVRGPIEAYLAGLGQGDDPVRRRNRGAWQVQGAWSVRLKPGGRHVNHTHPQGWLSSACYIALPAAVQGPSREGWLKFGEPGVATDPTVGPEHWVKPEPGLLALFPSYMWHGTSPFSGAEERLTIAFDLVPGPPGGG